MFQYLREKLRHRRQKRTFGEYGHRIDDIRLPRDGVIQYANWLHPLETLKSIEQDEVDFYRQFVSPGDLVLDIGAHAGDTAVPMALAAGKSGLVLAIEPNPYVFAVLKINAGLNPQKTSITPLRFAATAEDGDFTFGARDASFNNGGLVGFTSNRAANSRYRFHVEGKNLDRYLRQNYADRLERLTLVKVDAEGYDKEILKSLTGLIAQYRPTIITECYKCLNAGERSDLFETLHRQHYELRKLDDLKRGESEPIGRGDMQRWKHFDLLALPRRAAQAA